MLRDLNKSSTNNDKPNGWVITYILIVGCIYAWQHNCGVYPRLQQIHPPSAPLSLDRFNHISIHFTGTLLSQGNTQLAVNYVFVLYLYDTFILLCLKQSFRFEKYYSISKIDIFPERLVLAHFNVTCNRLLFIGCRTSLQSAANSMHGYPN